MKDKRPFKVHFENPLLSQKGIIASFSTYKEAEQYIFEEEKTSRGKVYWIEEV